jgi:hypothetical protein
MPKKGLPSFQGFLANMMPFMANDAKNDVEMSPQQMDALVRAHINSRNPRYLDAHSFLIAGLVDNESTAEKALKACIKHGYILPVPQSPEEAAARGPSPMTVNTNAIDKHFANNVGMISVHAQRKLVALLFFWEDECNRWAGLDREEAGIREAMQGADPALMTELQTRLASVEGRKTLLPSQRSEGTGQVIPPMQEQLPGYAGYAQK